MTSNMAAVRALSLNLELRSRIEPVAKSLRDLHLVTRTKQFADDFRVAMKPRLQRLAQTIGPEVRRRTAGVAESLRTHATPVKRWLSQQIGEEMYGKTFVAGAAMTALFYLIAREMKPSESWQRPGRLMVAFAGMLLCALTMGLGYAILFRARQKLFADSSELLHNAVRWLRAPIYPLHIRELGSMGKAHTQRRA